MLLMLRSRRCVACISRCVLVALVAAVFLAASTSEAAPPDRPQPDEKVVFKQVGDVELALHVFKPLGWQSSDRRPAIVFFFGGGWVGGSPGQFYPHCRALADRGMVACAAEYRVRSRNHTTPFECVADGKSAVRYVRQHAAELGIDSDRIASGGGSAGGHVAACTGTIDGLDQEGEDFRISSKPNAMVLFNPVIDTGPGGYGYERLRERYKEISPVDHVRPGVPPTIIFHGTADTTVPYDNVATFEKRMKAAENRCELVPYEGQGHGFFNYGRNENIPYEDTVKRMVEFLKSLGYVE